MSGVTWTRRSVCLLPLAAMAESGKLPGEPYVAAEFEELGVTAAWRKYGDTLTWGKGRCLAILDDGCKLDAPEWQASLPWGKKVLATYDSIDKDNDPSPVPPGYHGTTVGFPSSLNHNGKLGIAYNDYVAHVRAVTVVHLKRYEAESIAAGLEWVIANQRKLKITVVNLAPLDDQPHTEPVATAIDGPLRRVRQLGIWVSAPCGNNNHTNGISWPACQPHCFGIGATKPGTGEVYLDRWKKTELLAPAKATSSSNAYAAASAMVLREAIEKVKYRWRAHGPTLPDAMMDIFRKTGKPAHDPATGVAFRRLDLLAALDFVFAKGKV